MRFFIDTANIEEIRKAKSYGLIDGVTTNPSLFARESTDWRKLAEAICKEVDGPVSLEVVGATARDMVREARELIKFGPNVVVKIPMVMEGLAAIREIKAMDIPVNCTLVFTPMQALLAAKAGAAYVSPFVGRLDDILHTGMDCVADIVTIFDNYALDTEILVASVRNPLHIQEAALLGADVVTVPFKVLESIARHPLTDLGLAAFLKDWEKTPGAKAAPARKAAAPAKPAAAGKAPASRAAKKK